MLRTRHDARVRIPEPLNEVVRVASEREVEPRGVGLTPRTVDRIWQAVTDLYRTGLYPAITFCVRRHGQVVLDRSIGHRRGNTPRGGLQPDAVVCTPDTPFCIFSASKAITAMVIHLLDDRGVLHVDDRVADYIPEFACHGKEWVTIRHVLTHRSGIPTLGDDASVELLYDHDGIVRRLCEARPVSAPGRRLAYHAITGGFILGEIVKRATGRPIERVLREEILDPLGFRTLDYGYPRHRLHEVAYNCFTGPPVPFPASTIARRALGLSFEQAAEISNHEAFLTTVVPSGNVVGTANEVSRFFQLLLNGGELDGVRIFDRRTIRRAVNETAYHQLDLTLALPVRYGVGLMLGSDHISPFGPRTRRAFGHLGFINIFAWADPDRDLSVALLTSGKPFLSTHLVRLVRLVRRISSGCPRRPGGWQPGT